MKIDRDRILTLIPHAGAMCLLDEVTAWDETSLHGVSRRYRDNDNPLRRADGVLGAASGVEIAAQAMALHGSLSAGDDAPPVQGFIASVRNVVLHRSILDEAPDDLLIAAERLMGDANGASYKFRLACNGVLLVSGRVTVLLRPAA